MELGSRSAGSIMTGAIITCIGIVLLLQELGLHPLPIALYFWPSVIFVVGMAQVFMSDRADKRSIGVMIVIAACLVELNDLQLAHLNFMRLWPLLIVAVGLLLLWPRKSSGPLLYEGGRLEMFFLFSGTDRKISSKSFHGGQLMAVFGGYKLDLSGADIDGEVAVLNLSAVFGGGEIVGIPENWRVFVDGTIILGGYDDRTTFVKSPDLPAKTLVIKGTFLFGGLTLRN